MTSNHFFLRNQLRLATKCELMRRYLYLVFFKICVFMFLSFLSLDCRLLKSMGRNPLRVSHLFAKACYVCKGLQSVSAFYIFLGNCFLVSQSFASIIIKVTIRLMLSIGRSRGPRPFAFDWTICM